MNFKFLISNLKLLIVIGISFCLLSVAATVAHADAVTDNALNYLKSQQDTQGRITTGFSAPSQWSAIAFTINGIDVATIKNPDVSLLDFLLTDIPTNNAATDWETRILAIVAIGKNPTDFGGTNYIGNLESFYNNNQLGDTCSLNDDVFGLLALIAAGPAATSQIKQDTLHFLISQQDATDGGFGFSAPGCAWYMTSADMTGAALQALAEAKNYGLTDPGLDNAIDKAKAYLLANQNSDGGFGYFGSSDTDTTGWVLQGLNVAGMKDSEEAAKARTYLISQQSATDGGITAFDWGANTFISNASTTAQAIIALSGKGWIVTIFNPSATISATPTVTNTPTATPTPTSTASNNSSNNSPTSTPTPTPTPTSDNSSTTLASLLSGPLAPASEENKVIKELTITPEPDVLAATDTKSPNTKGMLIAGVFAGLGVFFVFIYLAKPFIIRKFK